VRITGFTALLVALWMHSSCWKETCGSTAWFRDADGDGLGMVTDTAYGCDQPPGYSGSANDFDDTDSLVRTRTEMAVVLLRSTEKKNKQPVLKYVANPGFRQHNLSIKDGYTGMIEAVEAGMFAGDSVRIFRSFLDSNFIVLHARYKINGDTVVAFHVFRLQGNKVVEHWDNIAPWIADGDSTTQLDGADRISVVADTEKTRQKVAQTLQVLFLQGLWSRVEEFFDLKNLIQHRAGFGRDEQLFKQQIAQWSDGQAPYFAVKFIHARGDFALALSESFPDVNGKINAHYDLFRLAEGRIVEHWDVVQQIPPNSTWAHSNGKW
jgi:predicted SnoaL-like aldol condensation-catalyzing enzyme